MALADLAAFKAAVGASPLAAITLPTFATIVGRPYDLWFTGTAPSGSAPGAAVAPTSATLGSIEFTNGASRLSILGSRFNAMNPGVYIIADRLSHQGGLSGTVTTAQTSSLPTAALTRYTGGDGVMLGLTVYSAVGATATTVSASYTNQAGTSGRTTPLVAFGGTGFNAVGRMIQLPLQAGDTGVRAVASVTVTATTGTAGNFGVVLYKPLYALNIESSSGVANAGFVYGGNFGGIPEILPDACLFPISIGQSTNSIGSGALILGDV